MLKVKYKQDGMKSVAQSLYSRLPETAEMKFVRDVSELQSEVSQTNRVRLQNQNQPGRAAEPGLKYINPNTTQLIWDIQPKQETKSLSGFTKRIWKFYLFFAHKNIDTDKITTEVWIFWLLY